MGVINRGAIVIKPRQPFLDWLRALPDPDLTITLEQVREDSSLYLLPDWDSHEGLQRFLTQCCADIFEQELAAWSKDASTFPENRAWPVFRDWFDVEAHSMVVNLMDGPLIDDEDEDKGAQAELAAEGWKEALARRMQSDSGRAAVLQDAEAVLRELVGKPRR